MPASTPAPADHLALPAGLRLGEFEIRGVLGGGGFGIVYRAWDHVLEREVAIKEYMPTSLATRSATHHVTMVAGSQSETFAVGLRSFVNEAKLLARFEHPSLVKVLRFWEQHGTAYMAMPYYRGKTLKALRKDNPAAPDEAWLRRLCEAVLGALEAMHREGVYHRDISPDNIVFDDDNRPVLLDFGAARRDLSGSGQGLTAILKPSYAPIEQYGEAGGLRQGPWTDLYALGATLHYMVTGHPPPPATARALTDERPALAHQRHGNLSREFLGLIDWLLAPRPERRPQDAAQVRGALAGRVDIPMAPPPVQEPADDGSEWPATQLLDRRGTDTARPAPPEDDDPDATIVRPSSWRPPGMAAAPPAAPPAVVAEPVTSPVTSPVTAPLAEPVIGSTAAPPRAPLVAPVVAAVVAPPSPAAPAAPAAPVAPAPRPAAARPAAAAPTAPARSAAPASPAAPADKASRLPWLLGLGAVVVAGVAVVAWLGRGDSPAPAVAAASAASAATAASAVPTTAAAAAADAAAQPALPSSAVTVIGAPAGASPASAPAVVAVPLPAPTPPVTTPPAAARAPTAGASAPGAPLAARPARPAASRPGTQTRPAPTPAVAQTPSTAPTQAPAAAQAEAPAPQPTPRASVAQPAAPERRDPHEACAGRLLVALHRCLLRECARPEFTQHPACVRARAIEQRTQDATTY